MQFHIPLQTVENDQMASSGATSEQSGKHLIAKKTMRDFVGLENIDNTSKDAMIRFSYLSSTGNMDEAFKAIKAIKRLVSVEKGKEGVEQNRTPCVQGRGGLTHLST